MTSENPDYRYEQDFQAIMEADDDRDVGIVQFNGQIYMMEDQLSDGETRPEDEEAGIDELNSQWPYHGHIATLTARLYLLDDDMREVVPESWGEPDIDEQGMLSYFVEHEELQSMGVMVGTEPHRTRIAYAFTFPNEDSEWPEFIMYPDEAAVHHYDVPTPEAVELKLRRRWPDAIKLVDTLIQPQVNNGTARRILALTRRLQPELVDSDFRELLVLYLNQRLNFDKSWPYIVQAENELLCFDGAGEPKGTFVDDDWVVLGLAAPLSIALRDPFIDFIPTTLDGNSYTHAVLSGDMSSPDDEYESAAVGVVFDNLAGLTATRVSRSIVERALMGYQMEDDLSKLAAELHGSDSVAVTLSRLDAENSHKPPQVVAMEFLEKDIIDFIESIKGSIRVVYDTEEQAFELSNRLMKEAADRLVGAGIDQFMLELSGERTMHPRTVNKLPKGFVVEPGTFIIQVDPEAPLIPLQHGDSITGIAESFLGYVEPAHNEAGDVVGYRAVPSLIAGVSREIKSLLNFGKSGAPLVEIAAQQRAAIPLDGSVEIRLVALEQYRIRVQALEVARAQYRNDPAMKLLKDIAEGLYNETVQFQEFKQVKKLRKVAERIMQNDLPGGNKPALDMLEALFLKRELHAEGGVIYPEDPSTIESPVRINGLVADVRNDIDGLEGPVFVMGGSGQGQRFYVPLHSLTKLAF